jgi:peptidoglycan biosynthesis protein MviN/MurJ (putative lipid II flippase)
LGAHGTATGHEPTARNEHSRAGSTETVTAQTAIPSRAQPLIPPTASTARSSVVVSISFLLASALGALLALLIAVIVGEGSDTDGFLAAYSAYLVFILFGSTLRVALIPLLGSTADEAQFKRRAAERVQRLLAAGGVGAAALLASSALLGRALVPGGSSDAQATAVLSIAILSLAAFCQIWSAALSAVLGAVRRFPSSAVFYVLSSTVTVTLASLLMALIGIAGAPLGVLGGAIVLIALHFGYLRRFDFVVRPIWRMATSRVTWRLAGLAAAGASVPVVLQLDATISLAAISQRTGDVTAYSYAYFFTVLATGITAGAIGLVTMPGLVASLAERGEAAADDYVSTIIPISIFIYLPIAVGYAFFGRPLVDAVLEGPLTPDSVDVLWDASRIFLVMGLFWVVLTPLITLALSLRLYLKLAIVTVATVPIHAALVIPAGQHGPVTTSAAHALSGTVFVIVITAIMFGRPAFAAVSRALHQSLPAAALALVFPAVALAGLAGDGVAKAVTGLTIASLLYIGLGVKLWPAVVGQAVRLLRVRA